MLFNSWTYAVFLPIVVVLYWLSPPRFRLGILLIASYIFYMSWRPVFIFLILGLTIFNYFAGLAIGNSPGNQVSTSTQPVTSNTEQTPTNQPWTSNRRQLFLILAIAANLSTLAFFKYAYFIDEALKTLLAPLGMRFPELPFDIILPLGISFFVFEFIHYIVDVHRGAAPIKSFPAFALFASFFPTQIAGPIKRFQDFIPQFLTPAKFSIDKFDSGIALILLGLFKKALIADNLAFFVQGGFSHPELFHGLDLWIFAYAFAFQIYFDFSGYTDIARGSARLFGYDVPINFNLPYLAANISDFWHRWHISLSTWLRDYLFIPLGGSRLSRWLVHRNLLLTMMLGGLWHGAGAHFVAWGLYHGLLLVAHRELSALKSSFSTLARAIDSMPGRILSTLLTFHAVCIGWVFFRAETTSAALSMLQKMLLLDGAGSSTTSLAMTLATINYPLIYPSMFLLLPALFLTHIGMGWLNSTNMVAASPRLLRAAWCTAMVLMIMVFSPDKSPRFIYFQF